jgi:hypothetical protein
MPTAIKKLPKRYFDKFSSRFLTKRADKNENKHPAIPKIADGKKSTFFLLIFIGRRKMDIIIKEKMFATCALFWLTDKRDKRGISTLPPPSPIAPSVPPITPINTNSIFAPSNENFYARQNYNYNKQNI